MTHACVHARYPIGGDHDKDAASTDAPEGAGIGVTIGAVAGAVIGVAIFMTFSAPLLLLAIAMGGGAYIGSLIAAMYTTRDAAGVRNECVHYEQRHSGVLLAVHVKPETRQDATDVLREPGSASIERASGRWQQGRWANFDPTQPPQSMQVNEPFADRARERHA